MMLVDTHVHLHFPDFQSEVDLIIERARAAGIRYFINVGTDLKSSRESVALAHRYDFVYATVGIHPHDAKEASAEAVAEI